MSLCDRAYVLLQHLFPQRLATAAAGSIASVRGGIFTHALIQLFAWRYSINVDEADRDLSHYATFNDFFTRALKKGVRPLASARWCCPVDATVSQCGPIAHGQLVQAKGTHFTAAELLGGAQEAAHFLDGAFATMYLSPRDYHRVHMPCDGRLLSMVHVPGALYSVSPATARALPSLWTGNERVVCLFETAHGLLAVVLVGATIVGSVTTVWHGCVNPSHSRTATRWSYEREQVTLRQGDELGRFLMGSTVILLWAPEARAQFGKDWRPGRQTRMGESLAYS